MGNAYAPPSDIIRHILEFIPHDYPSVVTFAAVHVTHRADVQRYSAWLSERLKDEPSPLPMHVWKRLFLHATHANFAFRETLDVSGLQGLRALNIKCCRNVNLGSLTQLTRLNMNHCHAITDVQSLTRLQSLDMAGYIGEQSLEPLTALTSLNMDFCKHVTGVQHCTNLTHLSMDNSDMHSYDFLTSLQSLTHLNARGCHVMDDQLLPGLTHLNMMSCQAVTNAGLAALTRLTSLNMSECTQITRLPLTRLTVLDMSGCKVADTELSALTSLTSLDISSCSQITDAGVWHLTRLTRLDMSFRSRVSDAGLQRLTRLTDLNIKMNKHITDAGIQNLTRLEDLNMRWCTRITDAGIWNLTRLTSLDMNTRVSRAALKRLVRLEHFPRSEVKPTDYEYGDA